MLNQYEYTPYVDQSQTSHSLYKQRERVMRARQSTLNNQRPLFQSWLQYLPLTILSDESMIP